MTTHEDTTGTTVHTADERLQAIYDQAYAQGREGAEALAALEAERNATRLGDTTNWAGGIVDAAINIGIEHFFPPAARLLWDAGAPLLESERDSLQARMGYVLMLDALAASPAVVQAALRALRDRLVEADPTLALLAGERPRVQVDPPLAVAHEIDGADFQLDQDAALTISGRAEHAPIVRLSDRETFGLLTFLRLPSVVGRIEAHDAQEQTEMELAYQASKREEDARFAA